MDFVIVVDCVGPLLIITIFVPTAHSTFECDTYKDCS
jgi:hypothetical protein